MMDIKTLTKEDVQTLLSVYADLGQDQMIADFWDWFSHQEM